MTATSTDSLARAKALLAELAVLNRYAPRMWAQKLEAFEGRAGTIVAHRRMGKTIGVLNYHKRAARNDDWEFARLKRIVQQEGMPHKDADIIELMRGRQYGHVLPTLTSAKKVAWLPLKWYCGNVPGVRFNESELSVKFPPTTRNPMGSMIRLFGADDPDSLRGFPLWGVSYDEYSQMAPETHGEVVSKSLADHLGYHFFVGTLKGKNQLYRNYEAMKDDPRYFTLWQDLETSLRVEDPRVAAFLKKAYEDDLDQVRMGMMTQEELDQEWHLSTVAAIKGAYYSKQIGRATRERRIGRVPHDPALLVHDVWDLGKGPQLSVGCFQKHGPEIRMIYACRGSESDGIPQMVKHLLETGQARGWTWGRHYAPHDVKATDLGTGKSRLQTAASLGWPFAIVRSVPVDDGIELGRAMFDRAWINEADCQLFLDAIGSYQQGWDEKRGVFTGVPVHNWASHDADMWRYAAVSESEMNNEHQQAAPVIPLDLPPIPGVGWTR